MGSNQGEINEESCRNDNFIRAKFILGLKKFEEICRRKEV